MKQCTCDHHLDSLYPKHEGLIGCENCDGIVMCHFGEQPHAATIVMTNSYACFDHVEEAKAKFEEKYRLTR